MMYSWQGMGGYWPMHLVFLVFAAAVVLYPVGRILVRLGLSPFWAVLAIVPIVNVLSLWLLAFVDWPAGRDRR